MARDFEGPSPGSWDSTRSGYALANEEAAHAAFCLYFDIEVKEARVDSPISEANVGGWVRTVPDTSTEGLENHLKVTLAGPLATGREIPWPPSMHDGGDETVAARLVYILRYDKARWDEAVSFVRELLQFPTIQRAVKAISGALLERGAIPGDELQAIVSDARARSGARLEPSSPSDRAGGGFEPPSLHRPAPPFPGGDA